MLSSDNVERNKLLDLLTKIGVDNDETRIIVNINIYIYIVM